MNTKSELLMIFGGNLLVLILLASYRNKRSDPAILLHFYSQIAVTFSYPFMALRFASPLWVFPYFSSSLVILGSFFEGQALARLADSWGIGIRRYLVGVLLAGLILYSGAFLAMPELYLRVIIVSMTNAALLVPTTLLVLRKRDKSALRFALGIFFLCMTAGFVIRVVDALRLKESLEFFGPSIGERVTVYTFYGYLFLGGMGIVLLSKEKTDILLERLAFKDEPTGLLNRNGFRAAFEEAAAKAAYDNESFTFILAELDGLGAIDDQEGPEAGDKAVAEAARALEELAGRRGFVGRLAGGRFALFIRDSGSQDLERLSEDFDGMGSFNMSMAALAFDCPAGKSFSYDAVYTDCAASLREAKAKGAAGRVVRTV
ncbi:MAG TPA: GGDEF domain-containing protein [Rectinemataceae bacterium]